MQRLLATAVFGLLPVPTNERGGAGAPVTNPHVLLGHIDRNLERSHPLRHVEKALAKALQVGLRFLHFRPRARHCRSAILDAELCLPGAGGVPDFYRIPAAMRRDRQSELVVYVFDLLHRDGRDLGALALLERRRRLERLLARSNVPCLRLVETFSDGERLLASVDRLRIEGIVSKRKASPYRSGATRDWRKIKTGAWRVANREIRVLGERVPSINFRPVSKLNRGAPPRQ